MNKTIDHIIQEYGSTLFKVCLGYSTSVEDAQDLLQEVLINIWKNLDSFQEKSALKTWLYRIAVNTCLMKLRKKTVPTIAFNKDDFDWMQYNPSSSMDNETFEILHQLIQDLPEQDKSITLLYLEGLSHKEIADVTGITANYVGVKINRIKQTLSQKIKSYE
jgi:RNA polymerase sigma-70 factor (ECF subfamily)